MKVSLLMHLEFQEFKKEAVFFFQGFYQKVMKAIGNPLKTKIEKAITLNAFQSRHSVRVTDAYFV